MTTIDAVMLFNIAVLPGQQGRNSRPCRNIMGVHPQNAKYIIQDNISQYRRGLPTRIHSNNGVFTIRLDNCEGVFVTIG